MQNMVQEQLKYKKVTYIISLVTSTMNQYNSSLDDKDFLIRVKFDTAANWVDY